MKQLLRGLLGFATVVGLALAVMWLVRAAPGRQPVAQATVTTETSSAPDSKSVSETKPKPVPTIELRFDKVKVSGTETITEPTASGIVWSPDHQKALLMREFTHEHILARNDTTSYSPVITLDLWVWRQQTGQETKVTDRAIAWDWSPDSQAVVYLTTVGDEGLDGELYVFDLETQKAHKVSDTDLVQAYPGPFWLSSDEIIYMDDAQLWIIRPDGSNRRLLNNLWVYRDEAVDAGRSEYDYAPDKLAGRLYISPDETRMAYETMSSPELDLGYQVRVADLTGDNLVTLGDYTGFNLWASDGKFLVYQKAISYDGRFYFRDLWMMDSTGSNPRRLLDAVEWGKSINHKYSDVEDGPGDIGFVTLSPDNKLIALSELNESSLWLLDIASSRLRFLYQGDSLRPLTSLEWLDNNQLIVSINSGTPDPTKRTYFRLFLGN